MARYDAGDCARGIGKNERKRLMLRVQLNSAELEYDEAGAGEPLLAIHGGFIANTFHPLLSETRLTANHRVISYNRRGFGGSSRAATPFPVAEQAGDARALLEHLGIRRTHVAGHSYGGVIGLQLALDAPELVASLALLEPALISQVPAGDAFMEMVAPLGAMFERGECEDALDGFMKEVMGPTYRELFAKYLPAGAFELAVKDAGTTFGVDLGAWAEWSFTAEEAARIRQPVLSVIGEESATAFQEIHSLVREWMPHAEELVIPRATHALQFMNPSAVADGLSRFLDHHHI